MVQPVQELPAELAGRLQRLADTQTSGSRPWPGVDLAVRRSHRRRVAGVSTLAAVSVLAAAAAFGGLLNPAGIRTAPVPPAAPTHSAPVVKQPQTPQEAGLTGAAGGSLAGDGAWLEALRDRVVALTGSYGTSSAATSRQEVLVLWAGDLNGERYAVVDFPQHVAGHPKRIVWASGILHGPAGAAAGRMKLPTWTSYGSTVPDSANSELVRARTPDAPSPGLVFVTAPRASAVEVATARRFGAGGKVSTDWRPLQKQGGAVWVAQVNEAEMYLFGTRVTGMASGGGSGITHDTVGPALAVAAPGTDRAALQWASDMAHGLGASLREKPVLAASAPLGGPNTLAATVLRSPDGGYLFGLAEQYLTEQKPPSGAALTAGAISQQVFASPEAFMAAVKVSGDEQTSPKHPRGHYLVIAPQGSATVSMRGVSVPVRNRLAVVDATPPPYPYTEASSLPEVLTRIQALDVSGQVIGTTIPLEPGENADRAGAFAGRPQLSSQYFGNYDPR